MLVSRRQVTVDAVPKAVQTCGSVMYKHNIRCCVAPIPLHEHAASLGRCCSLMESTISMLLLMIGSFLVSFAGVCYRVRAWLAAETLGSWLISNYILAACNLDSGSMK